MDVHRLDVLQAMVVSFCSDIWVVLTLAGRSPSQLANERFDVMLRLLIAPLLSVGKTLQDHLVRFLPQV